MIGISNPARIFLRRAATDMRKSFDGLGGLIREEFSQDPLNGDWFVFMNRRRDIMKVLYWDRDGFALWAKRLERGRYAIPGGEQPEIDRAGLAMMLEGVKARIIFRSPRWTVGKR